MKAFRPVRFGKYLLLDKIAAGGMAELYRAKIMGDEGFEKLIAIKKILPHLTVEESLISSFIHEAKLAALLHHQNIVQIYDFGNIEGFYFISMEYLFGKDLRTVIKKSEQKGELLSLENALYIASRLCSGLFYAHTLKDFHGNPLNIIHRDIGPHNIFITYNGQVKIIDFGIAKTAIQDTHTQTGSIKGKIGYMSPEQALGETIDNRSDIYSLGIVLYEMVTHKGMFEGKNIFQAYAKAREGNFNPPEEVKRDLPPLLYDILRKALASQPIHRYQSADEMLTDLDRCITELSLMQSDRCLSNYMKSLFEDESGVEETALREEALIHDEEEKKDEDKSTLILSKKETLGGKNWQSRIYVILLTILIAIGVTVSIIFIKNRLLKLNRQNPVLALKHLMSNKDTNMPVIPPENKNTPFKKIEELIKSKQFENAIALVEKALIAKDLTIEEIRIPYALALQGHANTLINNDKEKAQSLLHKSINLDPNNIQVHYLLGKLYMNQKNNRGAIDSYEKAIALDPLNPNIPKAFFNLGYLYAQNHDFIKSEKMYEQVIALSPPFVDEAFFNLAYILAKRGKTEQSIDYLNKALSVNPKNDKAKKLLQRLHKK
ncbi:MAG: protein kinase domain-containing protein [bacterium]